MSEKAGKFLKISGSLTSPEKEYRYGTNVKCNLKLDVIHGVEINFLDVKVCVEIRGELRHKTTVVHYERLSNEATWQAGETLNFQFDFCPEERITFKGRHVQFSWYVETDVDLKSKSKNELRMLYAKDLSLINAFSPEKEYDRRFRFTVLPKTYSYVPNEFSSSKKTTINFLLFLIPLALLIICLITGFWFLIVGGVAVAGILGYSAYTKREFHTFKKIDFSLSQQENNYQEVKIKFEQNWNKIKALDFYYEAREYVEDGRGTNRYVYERVIARTRPLRKKNINQVNTYKSQINLSKVPSSYADDDIEIQWFLIFKVHMQNGNVGIHEHRTEVDLNPYYIM